MGVALPRPLTAECAMNRAFTLSSPFGERGEAAMEPSILMGSAASCR